MHHRLPALLGALVLLAAAVASAGCGSGTDRPETDATLLLDFEPNAVHAGIYSAIARGYDDAEGVHLRVRAPSSTAEGLKLLLAGRAQFAILDIHDLALARQQGRDVVGVLAIVQRPLASVLAAPDVSRPSALAGRKVGVTGVPSDDAVLASIVQGDGGDPTKVEKVTIGFNAVASLIGGRVQGATAFWNVEGVALKTRKPGFKEFRVDRYGAPAYPELVLTTMRRTLDEDPSVVRATADAIARGYDFTLTDPESSAEDLIERNRGLDRKQVMAELDAVSPIFKDGASRVGELSEPRLREWAAWEARFGITKAPPDVEKAFGGPYFS